MAAMDFPTSPTNGQVSGNYYFDSSVGAWRINNSGNVLATRVTTLETTKPTSQNYLINGGFDIWQRGTSGFANAGYVADRWYTPNGGGLISKETTDLPTGFAQGIKFVTTGAGQYAQFNQALEASDVISLRGKTVTVSGWVKITGSYSSNWISKAWYSTSSDAYASQTTAVTNSTKVIATSATTSWTYWTNTFAIPTDAVGLRIENIPDVVQPSGVTVRITGMQLEVGSTATPFRRAGTTVQGELLACKRFFQRYYGGVGLSLAGAGYTSTGVLASMSYPEMRAQPSLSAAGAISMSDQYVADINTSSVTLTGAGTVWTTGCRVVVGNFPAAIVNGRWYSAPSGTVGSGYFDLSAEL